MHHSCPSCNVNAGVCHRQKQVDRALARARLGQPPSGKCAAVRCGNRIVFWHYQHCLLVYDERTGAIEHRWHQKPTDLRILLAVQAALGVGVDVGAA